MVVGVTHTSGLSVRVLVVGEVKWKPVKPHPSDSSLYLKQHNPRKKWQRFMPLLKMQAWWSWWSLKYLFNLLSTSLSAKPDRSWRLLLAQPRASPDLSCPARCSFFATAVNMVSGNCMQIDLVNVYFSVPIRKD